MRIPFIIFFICSVFQQLSGQTVKRDSIINVLEEYATNYDVENLMRVSTDVEKYDIGNSPADSLFKANVLFYKAEAISYSGNLLKTRKAYEDVIQMCPNSEAGTILKILTIIESTVIESLKGLDIIAYKKTKKANSLIEHVQNISPAILLSTYNNLALLSKNFGENAIASSYLKKSQTIFNTNEHQLSFLAKTNYYNDFFNFYKDTDVDEDIMIAYFNKHKQLYIKNLDNSKPEIFMASKYLSSQTKMGEFYLHRLKKGKKDSAKKALNYLNNVLAYEKQNNVIDYYKKIAWYLKNEILLIQNKLEEALNSNTKLITFSKEKGSRMRYNRAQRIRLLLRLHRVEEARKEISKMVMTFHTGSENLKKDFSNFTPFQPVSYTHLTLPTKRIV